MLTIAGIISYEQKAILLGLLIFGFLFVIRAFQKQEEARFYRNYDERHKWDEFHESRSSEDTNRSYLCAGHVEPIDERKERSWPI